MQSLKTLFYLNTFGNESFAKTSPTGRIDDNDFIPFLAHVTLRCYVADMNPRQYIPLHFDCKEIPNAVANRTNLTNGDGILYSSTIWQMLSAWPVSVIVPLKKVLELFLDTFLSSVAEIVDDAAVVKRKFVLWYKVVVAVSCRQQYCSWWIQFLGREVVLHGRSLSFIHQVRKNDIGSWQESKMNDRNSNTLNSVPCTIFSVFYGNNLTTFTRKHSRSASWTD